MLDPYAVSCTSGSIGHQRRNYYALGGMCLHVQHRQIMAYTMRNWHFHAESSVGASRSPSGLPALYAFLSRRDHHRHAAHLFGFFCPAASNGLSWSSVAPPHCPSSTDAGVSVPALCGVNAWRASSLSTLVRCRRRLAQDASLLCSRPAGWWCCVALP